MINHKPKCIKLSDHTFKHWLKEMDKENEGYLKDLADYGAMGGFSGMTTYKETNDLYEKYEKEIWEGLDTWSQETGYTILEVLDRASKNLKMSIEDEVEFKNLCVWWYAEVVAQGIVGYQGLL